MNLKPELDITGEAAELLAVRLSNRADFQKMLGLKLLLPRPMDLEDVWNVRLSLGTGRKLTSNGCIQPMMRPSRVR